MAESEEELKSLLMKEKESEKVGLKLNIQKTKIMASSPITSWQIDGETMETVTDFIFLAPKITADGDLSHEIKKCLLFGRKVMTNLVKVKWSRSVVSDSLDMSLSELQELVMDREAWCAVIHGIAKSRTWLSDWTEWEWMPGF